MGALQESRLMSITHHEFLRSLDPLKRHYTMSKAQQGRKITLHSASMVVEIELEKEHVISMGALSLPRTRVNFIFRTTTAEEKALFLNRFDLCFRRGGG